MGEGDLGASHAYDGAVRHADVAGTDANPDSDPHAAPQAVAHGYSVQALAGRGAGAVILGFAAVAPVPTARRIRRSSSVAEQSPRKR